MARSRRLTRVPPAAALLLVLAGCQPQEGAEPAAAPAETAAAPQVEYAALADRLVGQTAGVMEGDRVLISGSSGDQALLEELAVQVRRRGAFPLITLGSESLSRRMVVDVPEQYDAQEDRLGMALANTFDVLVSIDFPMAPDLLADVPPARMARRAQAGVAVQQALMKRNVRTVSLGNAMVPSAANAARLGLPEAELASVFWAGVAADPGEIQRRGAAVRDALAGGSVLRITTPAGTDLSVRVEQRPVFVSDGAISPEERRQGGAAALVWLPAGEVYLAPVPGTAEGTVVVDRQPYQGREIEGLTLNFAAGSLTGMSAVSGIDAFQADYDAAAPGKEVFAFVDFGINPAVRSGSGAPVRTWVADGMVSVGLGDNTWAGGGNNTPFGFTAHLAGATVTLDGNAIVENGNLKLGQ